MKTLKLLTFLALGTLLFNFSACDSAKDLADITFDASMDANIDAVSASETRAIGYTFSGSAIIDPTSDENIKKYWDNIKEWNIQKITVKVLEIEEDAELLQGSLVVKDNNNQALLYTAEAESLPLTPGTMIMEITDGDWSQITGALNQQHALLASVEGALDKPDIHITLLITIYVRVTANPL